MSNQKYIDGILVSKLVKDLRNQVFGRLTVFKLHRTKNGAVSWWCECSCENIVSVRASGLKNGETRSCGCLRKETTSHLNKKHNGRGTSEYGIWKAIKTRCFNPNDKCYHIYGGRGITICGGFRNDFQAFLDAVGPRPSKNHSIDRRNNSLNYSCGVCDQCLLENWPMNIRWATTKEQSRNTRRNKMITYQGETKPLVVWAEQLGLDYHTVCGRLNREWSVEDCFEEPVADKSVEITYQGRTMPISEWAKELGIVYDTFRDRIMRLGWSVAESIETPVESRGPREITYLGKTQMVSEWARESGINYRTLLNRLNKGWTFERAITTPVKSPKK